MPSSYLDLRNVPSAFLSDGALLTVPLWSVTTIALSESYHMPPIGTTGARSIVGTHDDKMTLSGVLVGPERYAWKLALETLAETGRRGSALAAYSGGAISGLVLVTAMTIRTDMQVENLSFTATAAKRDALDVSMTLVHMPRPSVLRKLFDVASIGVGALADALGD
jgi:phage protein U